MLPVDLRKGLNRENHPLIPLPTPSLRTQIQPSWGPRRFSLTQPSWAALWKQTSTSDCLCSTSRMTVRVCRPPKVPNCLSHTQQKVLELCSHWGEENPWRHKCVLSLVAGPLFRSILTSLPSFPPKCRASWVPQSEGSGLRARLWGYLPKTLSCSLPPHLQKEML